MTVAEDRTVLETFVAVTDGLVSGIDVDTYLHWLTVRTAELLDTCAVAVLFAHGADRPLDVAASSGRLADLLARYEVILREGPGVDAFQSGAPVACLELSVAESHWPKFAPVAVNAGLAEVRAVPCRCRDEMLGTLTMYTTRPGGLGSTCAELGRAMANAVALGVTARRQQELTARTGQLQYALHSRVVIEQAKGLLAERLNISIGEAFEMLRRYARSHNAKLRDVARKVLSGALVLTRR
jgi:hypothetical protein